MHEFGQAFGAFGIEAVPVEIILVLVGGKQFACVVGRMLADGDQHQRQHIAFAGFDRAEEIGDAELALGLLPGQIEARDDLVGLRRSIDQQRVACRLRGKVTVQRRGQQHFLRIALHHQPVEDRIEFAMRVVAIFVDAAALGLEAPLEFVQRIAVDIGQHRLQRHLFQPLYAPKWRLRNRIVGRDQWRAHGVECHGVIHDSSLSRVICDTLLPPTISICAPCLVGPSSQMRQ